MKIVTLAARPSGQAAPPASSPEVDSIADAVSGLVHAHREVSRQLDLLVQLTPPDKCRDDLLEAVGKCEATRFYAIEAIRRLEQLSGRRLMPANV